MQVCRQYQISWSHFLGGSPGWTSEDRAKAIVYEGYLAGQCPRCGTRKEDFYEYDEEGNATPLDEPMYYAEHDQCPGCEAHGAVDKVLDDDQRKRGYFTRWIPAEELDDDDEQETVATQPDQQKLPGLA